MIFTSTYGLFGLFGLALVLRGLVGTLVPNVRDCARCGQDTRDLPGLVCPECGTDLSAPGSTRPRRLRHRRMVVFGSLVLVLSGAFMARPGSWTNPYTWLPDGALRWCVESAPAVIAGGAAQTLGDRWKDGTFTAAARTRIVAGLVRRASDPQSSWHPSLTDLMVDGWLVGFVDLDSWTALMARAVKLDARSRTRVRAGSPSPILVECGSAPYPAAALPWPPTAPFPWIRMLPPVIGTETAEGDPWSGGAFDSGSVAGNFRWTAPERLGPATIGATFRFEILSGDPWSGRAPVGWFEISRTLEVEVVAADEPIVTPDPDPSLAEVVRTSLHVDCGFPYRDPDGRFGVLVPLRLDPIDADLAFECSLRAPGGVTGRFSTEEWCSPAGTPHRGFLTFEVPPGSPPPEPGAYDLILRPSIAAAERLDARIGRPWTGGEIVFPGIEVKATRSEASVTGTGTSTRSPSPAP